MKLKRKIQKRCNKYKREKTKTNNKALKNTKDILFKKFSLKVIIKKSVSEIEKKKA